MNPGEVIAGRYVGIAELAAGGMGVTYRAWDQVSARPVVIKMPNQACLSDSVLLARFRREIDLMSALPHPGIVPIVDHGDFRGNPFVAMPFLPGGALSDRMAGREGKGQVRHINTIRAWLPAMAEALDFLHRNQVVHRDVKPSNIFFNSFWAACLGDFGLAKDGGGLVGQDLTATNTGLGTLSYTAPEQMQGSRRVDGRADQYSLAVTVFEYLAGRKPFTGEKEHIVIEILQRDPPDLDTLVSGAPRSLSRAVRRALSRSPEERFRTCREFCEAVCQDVLPWVGQKDVARMLCPGCKRVVKLRLSAAGRSGPCPKCRVPITAANDLSAFWLVSENPAEATLESVDELLEALPVELEDGEGAELEVLEPASDWGNSQAPTPYKLRGSGIGLRGKRWSEQDMKKVVPVVFALVGVLVAVLAVLVLNFQGCGNSLSNTEKGGQVVEPVVLGEEEAAGRVANHEGRGPLVLDGYQEFGPGAAVALANAKCSLALKDLQRVSVEDAINLIESAGSAKNGLTLGITRIVPEIAVELAQYPGANLWLDRLEVLDSVSAEVLSEFKGECLSLDGLKKMDANVAAELVDFAGKLIIGVGELEENVAQQLSGHRGGELWLNKVTKMAPKAANAFQGFKQSLSLDGLKKLSPEEAESLAQVEGALYLKGLERLSQAEAKSLAGYRGGDLWLSGLKVLDANAAAEFSVYEGSLHFDGIKELDDVAVAQSLSRVKGGLDLNGLTSLDPEVAKALASLQGQLDLDWVKSLSVGVAQALSNCGAEIYLRGVTEIEAGVAEALSKKKVGKLALGGLKGLGSADEELLRTNPLISFTKVP